MKRDERPAMNARLQEIWREVENHRDRLLALVTGIPAASFGRRREPGGWSVAEVLHHLCLMEGLVTFLLSRQAAKAREKGIGPDPGGESLLRSLDRFSIETVSDPIKAPESVTPRPDLGKDELLSMLRAARALLRTTLEEAADVDLGQLQFPHPVMGRINMYQWVLFLGKHEVRHLGQIEGILED